MQRKIKKKLRTAQVSRSKQIFFEHGLSEHGLGEHGLGESKEWSGCQRSKVNGQQSTVNSQRSIVKETKRQREEERESQRSTVNSQRDEETEGGREYLSLEGYTPAKMAARAA